MDTKLTIEQRRAQFAELYEQIPGDCTSDKLDWLVDNIYCSRTTALIWKMKESAKPPPESKLRLMRDKLAKRRAKK